MNIKLVSTAIGICSFLILNCMSINTVKAQSKSSSDYIFIGKVVAKGKSNVSFVKEDNDIYLVQVERVLKFSICLDSYLLFLKRLMTLGSF